MQTVVQTSGTESIVGLVSIILSALRQTNTLYKYENPIEYLEIEQWIDYSNTTLKQNVSLIKHILPVNSSKLYKVKRSYFSIFV